MNASIQQLRAFVAVAQAHSLAQASERIHLSQPALSIAIRKLEEAVGGPLFARTKRQLSLTPEGEAFLPVAARLLNDWAEAFGDLNELFSKQRGKVTIAALPTLAAGLLPGLVATLRDRYPRINLGLHDALGEEVDQMVREGRADMGLTVPPVASDALAFEALLDDHYVAVCPLGHPLLEQGEVAWAQLAGWPFVGISRLSSSRRDIDRTVAGVGESLDIICEVSQIATVGRIIAAGAGIGVLPALSFRQISGAGIDHRPLVAPTVARTLGLITRRRYPLSAAATAMQELIREAGRNERLSNTTGGE
ncbi:LysR family transcriptional regulator [Salinisphaera aquimarina]|uniref:LysR family transcriptional regulator n=1 Tax=Salinisphaera aquimarina TaxID=2094031 RepID=A0ABV7ELI2_9GAMM